MYNKYLITGATGFLGSTIAWMLHKKGIKCTVLVMKDDPHVELLPASVEVVYGDVLNLDSLNAFFNKMDDDTCLIHCAGIVSISSIDNPDIYKVNVEGTKNILLMALERRIKKTIYVSSIHAIPPAHKNNEMTEISEFDEELVRGQYAKSKAVATNVAIECSKVGLNISIVHPSGLIGPGDWKISEITNLINSYLNGKMRFASRGKNDFVDVRDVAKGILACADYGKSGECYLLTGHQCSIKKILEQVRSIEKRRRLLYLPLWFVKIIAPLYERIKIKKKQRTFLTPYSAYALGANSNYNHKKAKMELNYSPRPIGETIKDTVHWLRMYKFFRS